MNSIKHKLEKINEDSDSLDVLKQINSNITERHFHEHTHILYDIRTFLGKSVKNYVEIGSFVGASACLMLKHKFKTNVTCIDPLDLRHRSFSRTESHHEILLKNMNANNPYNRDFKIFKAFSYDDILIENIHNIDILHIDGNHEYDAVIQDFNLYKDKVNSGGFIVFDDYHDYKNCPQVNPAVNEIVSNINLTEYEVVGCLNNFHKIPTESKHTYSNFIIRKT